MRLIKKDVGKGCQQHNCDNYHSRDTEADKYHCFEAEQKSGKYQNQSSYCQNAEQPLKKNCFFHVFKKLSFVYVFLSLFIKFAFAISFRTNLNGSKGCNDCYCNDADSKLNKDIHLTYQAEGKEKRYTKRTDEDDNVNSFELFHKDNDLII